MRAAQVGILLHHLDRLPAAELLQHVKGRAALDVPGRPGVAPVMKGEILDADQRAGLVPGARRDVVDRRAAIGKHPALFAVDELSRALAALERRALPAQDLERIRIERA